MPDALQIRALVEYMRAAWKAGDPEGVAACYTPKARSFDVEFEQPAVGRAG